MSYVAVALFWIGILVGRVLGGPDWCPAWLGLLIFVAMFPVHWVPVNRLADRALKANEYKGGEGR